VFMIHDSNIILVTKPSSFYCSLDDRVAVWITASSSFLGIDEMKSVHLKCDLDDDNEQDRYNSCCSATLAHV
jgi:hypothetical protein